MASHVRQPKVDIIIAARNEARHVRACLDALRGQDYPADLLRVYVVDNGSTDSTARIAEECGATVWHEPRLGPAAARNAALKRTSGELVGFLDAHCIVEKDWVRLMCAALEPDEVGGCQGSMENRSITPRVQKYLSDSGALSNARIIQDTVSGKRNLYPWILSGNCMYKRSALEDAGFFDDSLEACEDVDLAWRVVLLGYQLTYVPHAKLVHMNSDSWSTFVAKGAKYGRGAATLAAVYKPHGARETFAPHQIWSTRPEKLLSGLNYWAGYRWKELRLRLGLDSLASERTPGAPLEKFRAPFTWMPGISLCVSGNSIYWFREDDQTSVIVNVPTRQRIVLDSVGNFIWRRIARGKSRDAVIEEVSEYFGVAPITASTDLDDFVEELIEAAILIKLETAQPASSSLGP